MKWSSPMSAIMTPTSFVPFLWTIFLFVLFCNLLGMFPFLGSPTASFCVTGVLAIMAFFVIHVGAVAKLGCWGT